MEHVVREPSEEEPELKGGKPAQRLREFLAARFGDKAPPIPPDENACEAERPDQATSVRPSEEAGAPPMGPQRP
jgi:hypothetical protein